MEKRNSMDGLGGRCAIVGVGYTDITRRSDRSIGALAVDAACDAIRDAGLERADIDGYVGSPAGSIGFDEVSSRRLVSDLGLNDVRWAMDVQGMATGMVVAAVHALCAGTCNYVVAAKAMYNPATPKPVNAGPLYAGGAEQFALPYGIGPGGGRFALRLARYMHDHSATRDELFEIAALSRSNAQLNPYAIWGGADALSKADYLNARWINQPMCLYDADMPVCGAGAVILTTADRAKDLRQPPAYISGFSNAENPQRLFEMAGVIQKDVQVAQLYDGYSFMVWMALEELGFCERGDAHEYARRDRLGIKGELPINTFGGALGEGRLHGIGHLREGAIQVMGRGKERQVENVNHAVVHVGIPEASWNLLLSADNSN